MRPCPACRSKGPFRAHAVPACRHGPGPSVPYLECGACRSLFIKQVPDSSDEHYGPGYHYLDERGPRAWLRRKRNLHAVAGRGILGGALSRLFPPPLEGFPDTLRAAGVGPERAGEVRILDVGTGSGELLFRMADAGYQCITGVDPFLPEGLDSLDSSCPRRPHLVRGHLAEMSGRFDLVMFHHSLEHVPDPEAELEAARNRLAPGGRVLVRVPIVPCFAWEEYGVLWVQIDAPRHATIFSRTGLPALARRVGLELESVRDDSTEVQLLGSEMYQQGRPLGEWYAHYGWRQRRRWRKKARILNRDRCGDQAAFVFRASPREDRACA